MDREIFARRLKLLRTDQNLSMSALANAVGIKYKGTISQFEKMITAPSVDTLIALADYFNVSLDYLVGRSDDPRRR
ncbi:helix-turn-helix domain-containing protein [Desulfoscipio gibsoniae]